ncbi:MAG: tryptophanase, partial [Bacteroidia bacterium]|nr:tryptophanase [Bacteroidia bacterium]
TDHFKGNLDVERLKTTILEKGARNVAAVILTVTNNSGGGQPVSMANALAVSKVCQDHKIPMVLDGCRIAENAYFIHNYEPGYASLSYREIAVNMCQLADGFVMSAKKDGMVNMGGFLALRNEELADACKNLLIITEGFTTYGGLAGRDMEALAVGLEEVFDPDYLHYRVVSTAYLGDHLSKMGVPVILPVGGHAVYIDAALFYPQIPLEEYPGQALVCELYRAGGIRSVEVGSVMFGKYDQNGKLIPAAKELVRLALPRRVYTQSHLDYVIEVFEYLVATREQVSGYKITHEAKYLRHFTAHFEPLAIKEMAG